MKEIIINSDYGGFSLSRKAIELYFKKKGLNPTVVNPFNVTGISGLDYYIDGEFFNDRGIERDDPVLIEVVKELKDESFGSCATLKIVEIPDNVEWEIEEYDGCEWVAEKHRIWR